MRKISLTARLTIIFVLIMAAACGGITLTLYGALRHELIWRDDRTLINRALQLRQLLQDGAKPEMLPLYFSRMVDTQQDILLIRQAAGPDVTINQTGIGLAALTAENQPGVLRRQRTKEGEELTILSLQGESNGGAVTLTVARLARERAKMLEQYRQESLLVCLAALMLGAILSPLLIRRGLRAIGALSKITAATHADRLSDSVPLNTLPRELLPLGEALNVMRSRLAHDFTRLTRFADDLAHELRTPVNVMLSQNQVALGQERTPEAYQQLLEGNIEELENLSRLTDNILFLARADHHNVALRKEVFSLPDTLENITDFLEPLAEEKGLRFALEAEGDIQADKMLFQRALVNLITNAVRHAPENTLVRIKTEATGEAVDIAVGNKGEPLAETEKLFERFWRGDEARNSVGSGLGLALVKAIAELHGGYAWYQHREGENLFGIRLGGETPARQGRAGEQA
ncbi:two-component system OmpR family sensor kinase [Erwinia persicina]|jgi:two-component system OmpR family sensor kinase|uniref:Sensor protein n=2 Tax=Erwinia TaxID=551 RepID=A0ABV4E8S8_9GAMM|nr:MULTISPECIES: heavy metal sensor histidine kinase [Erwinia]MCP1440141.1 two-component system OmpR family sensor kinase [Erwinia persicina]MDN4627565.1 heavy metal sensor histidine kinase [Erwinia sp. PsM31]